MEKLLQVNATMVEGLEKGGRYSLSWTIMEDGKIIERQMMRSVEVPIAVNEQGNLPLPKDLPSIQFKTETSTMVLRLEVWKHVSTHEEFVGAADLNLNFWLENDKEINPHTERRNHPFWIDLQQSSVVAVQEPVFKKEEATSDFKLQCVINVSSPRTVLASTLQSNCSSTTGNNMPLPAFHFQIPVKTINWRAVRSNKSIREILMNGNISWMKRMADDCTYGNIKSANVSPELQHAFICTQLTCQYAKFCNQKLNRHVTTVQNPKFEDLAKAKTVLEDSILSQKQRLKRLKARRQEQVSQINAFKDSL